MARLAALVPTPQVNLTRYHGVFAPNHRLREQVTPARRGRRKAETANEPAPRATSAGRDPCLQTFRPGATANGITGPEGTRLTVLHQFSCMDAKLG